MTKLRCSSLGKASEYMVNLTLSGIDGNSYTFTNDKLTVIPIPNSDDEPRFFIRNEMSSLFTKSVSLEIEANQPGVLYYTLGTQNASPPKPLKFVKKEIMFQHPSHDQFEDVLGQMSFLNSGWKTITLTTLPNMKYQLNMWFESIFSKVVFDTYLFQTKSNGH